MNPQPYLEHDKLNILDTKPETPDLNTEFQFLKPQSTLDLVESLTLNSAAALPALRPGLRESAGEALAV